MMVEGLVEGYVIIIVMIVVPWSDVRGHECTGSTNTDTRPTRRPFTVRTNQRYH